MKKRMLSLMLIAGMFGFSMMGETTTMNRDVKDFNCISIKYPGTFYLKQGIAEALTIEGNSSVLKNISAETENGKLIIKSNMSWFERLFSSSDDAVFWITFKDLNSISAHGAAAIKVLTSIKTDKLSIKLSGSGNFNSQEPIIVSNDLVIKSSGSHKITIQNLIAKTVSSEVSGSNEISILSGTTDKQKIEISGSGKYNALNFSSKITNIDSSGSCNVNVDVSEVLDVNVSGSGKITYKGNPAKIEQKVSGSAKLQKNDE